MRRSTAISLLVLLLATLAVPAWAGMFGATAPICCRANGKHHCGMVEQSSPELSVRGPEYCPHRAPASFTAHRDKSYRPVAAASWEILSSASDIRAVSVVTFHAPASTYFDKRGPPCRSL